MRKFNFPGWRSVTNKTENQMEITVDETTREQLKCEASLHKKARLKREEECDDSILPGDSHHSFSSWKKLIGKSYWEDHYKGKEGAEKYRTYILRSSSCPGIYEIGIALPCGKVIPVYVGQADNLKKRLQQYGRGGAHLENTSLSSDPKDSTQRENRMFSEIFGKGFHIVCRWAHMKSKQEAEKAEADLLGKYDYAWNKGNNGPRRHNEILKKLAKSTFEDAKSLSISRKIRNIFHDQISAKFDPNTPLISENGSIMYKNQESNDVFSRIFKIGRSNPRRVTVTFDTNNSADICGVALGYNCVCSRPPVEGKKRCAEHKGMKINRLISVEHNSVQGPLPICGFTLGNGNLCTSQIVPGRKRCEEHKGEKVKQNSGKSKILSKKGAEVDMICGVNFEDGTFCRMRPVPGRKRCEEHKGKKVNQNSGETEILSEKTAEVGMICGVKFEDGNFCRMTPVPGRKRCEEHKGKKVKHQFVHCPISSSTDAFKSKNSKANILPEKTIKMGLICGVKLEDGTCCKTIPVEGRKKCLERKGMRVNSGASPSSSTSAYKCDYTIASFPVCGAGLGDGSICRMPPVSGRKRCEQHKGMRAIFW